MIVVPVLLMLILTGIARFLFVGEFESFGDGFRGYREIGRTMNRLVDTDPASLRSRETLDQLRVESGLSFSVWSDDALIAASSDLERLPARWPGDEPGIRDRGRDSWQGPHGGVPTVVFEWSFQNGVGTSDVVRVHFTRPNPADAAGSAFLFVLLGIGVLIATNGTLTYLVSRSILSPLRALEAAANRIAEGDLDDPHLGESRDEFGNLNRAFDEMRTRLHESLEAQERYESNRRLLIASLSHDLRTPLAAIRGYVEGIADGVASTPEQRERYLQTILERVAFADALVERLREFSQLDTGEAHFRLESVQIDQFLSDLVRSLALEFTQISLDLDGTPPSVEVPVDPLQLTRAFTNIVQNVAHHCPPGTSARVRAERIGNQVFVSVVDDGPGIPTSELSRVTLPSYRADGARGPSGEGVRSGLGLSIARMIVESHEGTIEVLSPESGGTTVTVTLPLEIR